MSLSTALNIAQRSLSNAGFRTDLVSRNISNAENPDYVRRGVSLESNFIGGANIARVERTQNEVLYKQNLDSISSESAQNTIVETMDQLKNIFGTNDYELSPAVLAGRLRDDLSAFAAKPNEPTLAETTVARASDLANALNHASTEIQGVRTLMDTEIDEAVLDLNNLLLRYQEVNELVMDGTASNEDVSDYLDERESLTKQISDYIGVKTVKRENNDVALYTNDGITLFEKVPRTISFTALPNYSAGATGNSLYIDGMPLAAGTGANTSGRGTLSAMLQIRDDLAPTLQGQMDEIARGVLTIFAEQDQSGGGGADMPGLFTWPSGTVPAAGVRVDGIAATIEVNPAFLSSQGGDPTLLRDGGANGAAYLYNTEGAAGYFERLNSLVDTLDTPIAFDGTSLLGTSKGVIDFAADSIGWMELTRSDATSAFLTKEAYNEQVGRALSNETGVSIDEEMSLLLTLEQSYKAATRIITAVDEMLETLLSVAR